MERFDRLIQVYKDLDTVFGILILLGVWAASLGHILDAGLHGRVHDVVLWAYWIMISILGFAGIVFAGLLNIGVLHD